MYKRQTNDGASWTQTAKLVASDAAEEDYFGISVAISGDLVVVGARGNDDAGSASGSAYVFRTTNGGASWTQSAKLVASDAAKSDFFGDSVAVSGDLVVVGAKYNADAGDSSGSAYVLSAPTPQPTPRPTPRPNPQPAPGSPTTSSAPGSPTPSSGGGSSSTSGGGADTIVVAAAAVAAVVAVAIACLCIKRRRTKAAAARADINLEAPPDRDDAFAGGARNVAGAARHSASTKTPVPSAPPASASFAAAPAAEPVPSARYQQLMRESEGVIAQGMNAVHVLLALGQVAGGPVVGPICEVARDILRSVEEHSRKADDVVMAGRRVVDVLGALQQMSKNAAKLEFGNADLVESKMRKLKGLLCDFKLAVDAFGRAGWLKRAFHQRGHVNSLTKLDKEIATCLESLKLDYKLAVDADILQRTYQMEQSITMLVAKRCSETREDPAAAAAILARTPVAIAEVVENAHVPEDELLIEMRELSGEVSKAPPGVGGIDLSARGKD